ncbi:MAG: hypothetical protein ABII64_08545 [Elusimicrobiota bacterium]
MTKYFLSFLAIMICSFSVILSAESEFGAGVGFSPWDGSYYQKKDRTAVPDKFIRAAAIHFGISETDLAKLWYRGYGRNELIKVILISRDAKQELKDVVKLRDKNMKYAKIAEKYTLDYYKFTADAESARKEIDYEVSVSTYTIEISTVTEKSKTH